VSPTNAISIIGVGSTPSHGVRKGEVCNPPAAEEDIRKALSEAENMANVEIRSAYLGVSGGHIRGFNNQGVHPVASAGREITEEDVQDVIKNAKAINLGQDNVILHSVRQHFTVNGQSGIKSPVGMCGAKVELEMHVVQGNLNRVQNPIRLVKGMQVEVEQVVFNGMASALAVLTNEQKETGALVIDIGGGTTEYLVYSGGVIKHSGVFAVGGDHVTNDLACGLKIPMPRAEELKISEGVAIVDETVKGKLLTSESEVGIQSRPLSLEHLQRIMALRLEEIFQLIAQELSLLGLLDYIRAGVFLCGGGSRIRRIEELASAVFEMPAFRGRTNCVSGLKSTLDHPEFITAIGLVKFGSMYQRRPTPTGLIRKAWMNALGGLFNRNAPVESE
jgi:cell division protein FtsA